jgi:hypothetical protein
VTPAPAHVHQDADEWFYALQPKPHYETSGLVRVATRVPQRRHQRESRNHSGGAPSLLLGPWRPGIRGKGLHFADHDGSRPSSTSTIEGFNTAVVSRWRHWTVSDPDGVDEVHQPRWSGHRCRPRLIAGSVNALSQWEISK